MFHNRSRLITFSIAAMMAAMLLAGCAQPPSSAAHETDQPPWGPGTKTQIKLQAS